ncbi:Fic family protein [Tistrella mobilis]|uniref:Fic family protein n=1 Tax=Tistrella mobilis TaxID=171437 RepID=UPI0035575454
MPDVVDDPVGAAWLMRHYGIALPGRLRVTSRIGGRRMTQTDGVVSRETWVEAMRPAPHPAAHLQFHLRHEVPHLDFLARLFAASGPDIVQNWVAEEPTGRYARRAAFLYEWLTGRMLQVPPRSGGNYVDAIDAARLVAASPDQVQKVARWRVNDNLPGTRHFCPILVRTPAMVQAAALDVSALFKDLAAEFGEDLLLRAAAWLTLRESRSSFAIEGEAAQATRIQRFADVMARRTGQGEVPLDDAALALLQHEILGEKTVIGRFGLRQSPVFIGETSRYENLVYYVAPPAEDLAPMLAGLRSFLMKTTGQSPVMRAAVAAFGFVYIHPLADGNGRVHRFLINDLLRRDGTIPAPVILPVSAVITDDPGERRAYDQVLDEVSAPLMQAMRDQISFRPTGTMYPDGIVSDIEINDPDMARPSWRYPDLAPHVVFLARILDRTIREQMRTESRYLRRHARARTALKEVVEMPDPQADRVLRMIDRNQGHLSNALAREMPVLGEPGVWDELVAAVKRAWEEEENSSAASRRV